MNRRFSQIIASSVCWRRATQQAAAEHEALWPLERITVLVDESRVVVEASIIIEHIGFHHSGPVRLTPGDPCCARRPDDDRFFDNQIMMPMQRPVFDSIRAAENRNRQGVADARAILETAYRWLDGVMTGHEWAAGNTFSLANCAAAPALFYADWGHPIGTDCDIQFERLERLDLQHLELASVLRQSLSPSLALANPSP